jgi:ribosomal-protein-serine acetyltransferase
MPIEIERGALLIRQWRESDAEALGGAVVDSLDHIRPWLPWARELPDEPEGVRAAMRAWLRDVATSSDEIVGLFLDGAVVGGSGLHARIGAGGLEIGYWVHRRFTRRGIATTASRELTDHAFAQPDIERVEIHHDKANLASGGVPRALGFSMVGEEVREPLTPQQTGVQLVWRITRAEWALRGP